MERKHNTTDNIQGNSNESQVTACKIHQPLSWLNRVTAMVHFFSPFAHGHKWVQLCLWCNGITILWYDVIQVFFALLRFKTLLIFHLETLNWIEQPFTQTWSKLNTWIYFLSRQSLSVSFGAGAHYHLIRIWSVKHATVVQHQRSHAVPDWNSG